MALYTVLILASVLVATQAFYSKGWGSFPAQKRREITSQCLEKPQSESPWVFKVPGYCAELTCWILEMPYSKHVRVKTTAQCPKRWYLEDCVKVDSEAEFPNCCPEPIIEEPRCPDPKKLGKK